MDLAVTKPLILFQGDSITDAERTGKNRGVSVLGMP